MKRLLNLLTIMLTACLLLTAVSASSVSPTPSSPTPGSPTPGSPVPGSPSPEYPLPGDQSEILWSRYDDASLAASARNYAGLDDSWVATEILWARYPDGSETLEADYNNTLSNLNIADQAEICMFHKVGNTWKAMNVSLVSAGKIALSIPAADGLGYFVIFSKATSEFTVVSKDTSKGTVDNDAMLLIVKNFKDFADKKSTQDNFNSIFTVENATVKFSADLVSTKSSVVYTETNGNAHTYRVIVLADVNCDGKVSAQDYILIRNHIMDISKVTDYYAMIAADTNEGCSINAQDYILIRNYIMGM